MLERIWDNISMVGFIIGVFLWENISQIGLLTGLFIGAIVIIAMFAPFSFAIFLWERFKGRQTQDSVKPAMQ